MLMGLFIFSLTFVGFVCGAFTMRFFVKRGAGLMAVCGTCRFKNLVAEATADDFENNRPDIPMDEASYLLGSVYKS